MSITYAYTEVNRDNSLHLSVNKQTFDIV